VLLTFPPAPLVHFTLGPLEDAVSVFQIILVLSLVRASIRPCKRPLPGHLTVFPATYVAPAIRPQVTAMATNLPLLKIALVLATVHPFKKTQTVALALNEGALKDCAIRLFLTATTMLLVLHPPANVLRA